MQVELNENGKFSVTEIYCKCCVSKGSYPYQLSAAYSIFQPKIGVFDGRCVCVRVHHTHCPLGSAETNAATKGVATGVTIGVRCVLSGQVLIIW